MDTFRSAHVPFADKALFAGFSIADLFLSGVGLYSVLSYSVAQRTNEFGIHMALGATLRHVLRIGMASAGVSVGYCCRTGTEPRFESCRLRMGGN
jgi:ABC-type antimicrobial peptide transport system permease subunit